MIYFMYKVDKRTYNNMLFFWLKQNNENKTKIYYKYRKEITFYLGI